MFDRAQLQGADLRNVRLQGVWLRGADVSGAQMRGVNFGELPYLNGDSSALDCKYSPDGRWLAVAQGSVIDVYWVSTFAKIHTLEGHGGEVRGVAFSADSALLASCSDDKTVRLWAVQDRTALHTFEGHGGSVWGVAF